MYGNVEILTGLYGCSPEFLVGETFLVFASREDGKWKSGMCSGSRVLSEAGEYLSYLHLLKHGRDKTARLFGWVTADKNDLAEPRWHDGVKAPRGNLVVALESASGRRLTETNLAGRFSFDRLAPGDYTLPVSDREDLTRVLASERVSVSKDGCVRKIVFIENRP